MIQNRNIMKRSILFGLPLFLLVSSCQDFLHIDPPKNELSTQTVFATDAVAESAIRGLYTAVGEFTGGFGSTFSALQGISSDELVNITPQFSSHYENSLQSTDPFVYSNWVSLYHIIYLANAAIEGINGSENLSVEVAKRLLGEAKFFRAFCYFTLLNLWGEVPLILSSDYRLNSSISRTSVSVLYPLVVDDLISAKELLPDDYTLSKNLRTRANKWAAGALLARVYLFLKEWQKAEAEADAVIENESLFELESDLNGIFLVTSREAILQFYPTSSGITNSLEGQFFLPTELLLSLGVPPLYPLTDYLLAAFGSEDQRRHAWVGSVELNGVVYHYPYKYKVYSAAEQIEFTVFLRLAEQYLIRAEARAHLGKINGPGSAESDINAIRNRAGLDNMFPIDEITALDAIMNERRLELFSEWGHRWFDLVRTERANATLGSIKSDWTSEDLIRPIPQSELNLNPFLTQNTGY